MRNILIPTDFSACADNALRYACNLATHIDINKISLLHAYSSVKVPATSLHPNKHAWGYATADTLPINLDELYKKLEMTALHCAASEDIDTNKINWNFLLEEGHTPEAIAKIALEQQYQLIVMATHGENNRINEVWGSTTASTLLRTKQMMLIVPPKATFKVPKKMVYAIDYKSFDINCIHSLESLARHFNSHIALLNIRENNDGFTKEQYINHQWAIEELYNYENMSIEFIDGDNFMETLDQYIIKNDIDILAMRSRKGVIENPQYYESVSRKMAIHTNVPLLVFH